ncbi:DUF6124 family protein [Pseudomonas frederiksbergensis]|jgi:DNA-binding MarR family transcriptional regulator|uniref:DUF3077 domain-containing protein n=1 Tax=Pseudomonas frederiksbergensis TaxID=104087 RepID=A0A423KEZ3_9PSED|nr:DUF6124 family protein [Pseudomonas frederiksbergensis]RON43147.1 hypothetical protein BK667_30360 [Pseudomonas frederiksbergensis]RON51204.1 hypothetical protein BK666_04795 [Pseudomonas frederiksbergensis]
MFKATPNPPKTDSFSATLDAKKFREAADRALDHYLKPNAHHLRAPQDRAMKMFAVAPEANARAITIQTYETFSSVSILLLDLAESLDNKPRHLAMAIYQLSEMGLLLVEKSLENEPAVSGV